MKNTTFTTQEVDAVSKLANIPVSEKEKQELADGFTKVLSVLDELNKVDARGAAPSNRVAATENVTREDEIDTTRMFTQEQALANAPKTHNGFFVAQRVKNET